MQPDPLGLQRGLLGRDRYQRWFCHALQENRPRGRESEEEIPPGHLGFVETPVAVEKEGKLFREVRPVFPLAIVPGMPCSSLCLLISTW